VISWTVALPWLLSLATITWGIISFTAQQRQANRQPFLKLQLDVGFLATETVARLATETDPIEWEKARITFWRLYWGQLSIAENPRVESVMVELGRLVPEDPVQGPVLPMKSLGPLSYKLAHSVRDLVEESWTVRLIQLPKIRLAGQSR
jgi:hypothetical protein